MACGPLALASACGSASTGLGGKSATQVLSIAIAAAQSDTFHFVDKDGSGAEAGLLVGDAGTSAAQQSLSGGGAALDVRLVNGVIYLRASAQTLTSVFGLSAPTASAESGKWLSVTKTDKGYREVVKTLTPDAELGSYIPQIPLTLGVKTRLHGNPVIPVSGAAPPAAATGALNAKATLFISTRAPFLPVGGTLTGTDVHGAPQSDDVAFTRWGEIVRPTVPAGAVPVASLTG